MTIRTIPTEGAISINKVPMSCDTSLGDDIAPPFPQGAFSMLLSGKPGVGKSTFLANLLTRKELYRRRFDSIYIMMPQNSFASLPDKNLLKKHDKVYHELTYERLQKIMDKCAENAKDGLNSLVVIDDFLAELKNHDIQKLLLELYSNRRHLRTSSIICGQIYNGVPLPLRKQLSHAVIWRISNMKESKCVVEELFAGVTKEQAEELMRFALHEKHDFMIFNLIEGLFYNSKMDQLVIVEDSK